MLAACRTLQIIELRTTYSLCRPDRRRWRAARRDCAGARRGPSPRALACCGSTAPGRRRHWRRAAAGHIGREGCRRPRRGTTAASFSPRLKAACSAPLRPNAPSGLFTCAASPTMRYAALAELGRDALMHAIDVGVLDVVRPGQGEEMREALRREIVAQHFLVGQARDRAGTAPAKGRADRHAAS